MAREHSAPRILFVDDEPQTRRAFVRAMSNYGFSVDTASNGIAALRKAQRAFYSAVVSDFRMPGMDGLTLIHRLEAIHPGTAFMLLTAAPEIDFPQGYATSRAPLAVMSKPWNDDELAATLRRICELYSGRPSQTLFIPPQENVLRLLLVEDLEPDALLIEKMLQRAATSALHLDKAKSLCQALELARQNTYDVIISDLTLPDATEMETVEFLCQASPETALIVMSGITEEEVALRAVQLGAQDYLVKGRIGAYILHRSVRYAMERKRTEQRLAHLAHFDQLTGLANRVTFRDRLSHTLARVKRKGSAFSLLFIDLDRFKAVNDSLGHEAGDILLQRVSERLKSALREMDTVARLGGDEFAAILEDVFKPKQIAMMCERILDSLEEPFMIDGKPVNISCSIGAASYPAAGETTREVLRLADEAMYAAKRAGRGAYRLWNSQQEKGATPNIQSVSVPLSSQHARAIGYQPIFDLERMTVGGLRVFPVGSNGGGTDGPRNAASIRTHLRQLLRAASTQLLRSREYGLRVEHAVVLLSSQCFDHNALFSLIRETQQACQLEPGALQIEVTQSTLMRDPERNLGLCRQLRDSGVGLAIAGVGAGFCSLAHLYRFEADALCIDSGLVRELGKTDQSTALCCVVASIGRALGRRVRAEGVQDAGQLTWLQAQNCQEAVGPYLGGVCRAWEPEQVARLSGDLFRKSGLIPIADRAAQQEPALPSARAH